MITPQISPYSRVPNNRRLRLVVLPIPLLFLTYLLFQSTLLLDLIKNAKLLYEISNVLGKREENKLSTCKAQFWKSLVKYKFFLNKLYTIQDFFCFPMPPPQLCKFLHVLIFEDFLTPDYSQPRLFGVLE